MVYNRSCIGQRGAAFLKEHSEWRFRVHGHMTSTASIYLPEAKRAKIALTAAHARSVVQKMQGVKGMMTKWMRKNLWKKRTSAWRSKLAFGKALWEKAVSVQCGAEMRSRG